MKIALPFCMFKRTKLIDLYQHAANEPGPLEAQFNLRVRQCLRYETEAEALAFRLVHFRSVSLTPVNSELPTGAVEVLVPEDFYST